MALVKGKTRQRDEKRNEMLVTCRKMDVLAKTLGKWDPQATIRKFRDTNLKGDG
jgi:hypothetical protein